ncbi:MAG TPA: hypothetical protein VIC34_13545, partial [Croceibacterium sp.]
MANSTPLLFNSLATLSEFDRDYDSLAMLAAMRHASSRMRSLAAAREHRWEAILSFSDMVQAFNARLLKAAEQLI